MNLLCFIENEAVSAKAYVTLEEGPDPAQCRSYVWITRSAPVLSTAH